MFSRPYNDTIAPAIQYAALKHAGQRRKGSRARPYIVHPIAVAQLLSMAGVNDRDILAAAVLHDTIEDTKTKYSDIAERFGVAVAEYVQEVTDDKRLPADERKRLQIVHAPTLSHGAKLIKLADKADNLKDLIDDPPMGWSTERKIAYVDWSDKVVAALELPAEGSAATLRARFDHYTSTLRSIL